MQLYSFNSFEKQSNVLWGEPASVVLHGPWTESYYDGNLLPPLFSYSKRCTNKLCLLLIIE